jgi:hypothetical protein
LDDTSTGKTYDRFHGRVYGTDQCCDHPACDAPGEFRAPKTGHRRGGFDGPGEYHWLCLDHVRDFNMGYDYFDGMSQDQVYAAQRPQSGWERETRAFATSGASPTPRWADFSDPLDAIGARFKTCVRTPRPDGKPLSDRDLENLQILGLAQDVDRATLRQRYAELVRKYHPDKNGGDRSHEKMLQRVIDAYTQLRDAPAFT